MQREPTLFSKTRINILIFRRKVTAKKVTRHFSCVPDISLWLKFGSQAFNRTTVIQKFITC